jgi:acetoacetyl-CoA synthetase
MAVEIFDSASPMPTPIHDSESPGELVCTQPFPSQPLAFFGNDGLEKYKASYFSRFGSGTWCQGDFIQVQKSTGGIRMLGRSYVRQDSSTYIYMHELTLYSDGVLNPSGVRFGSAEIYAITERFDEIEDCICVGQKRKVDADERVLLFVKMKTGHLFSWPLQSRIKTAIRQTYSARHVPKYIFEVTSIPYTINGKKCEINVKQIVSGMKSSASGTVANPESLSNFDSYVRLGLDGALDGPKQKL